MLVADKMGYAEVHDAGAFIFNQGEQADSFYIVGILL